MKKSKRDIQYKDAALGAFIGFVGILIMCLAAVVWSELVK